jgi:hypothetical protein
MSGSVASEGLELEHTRVVKPRLGRGLPAVDILLIIAAERHPISLWWLSVFLMEYDIKYPPRTLRWALKRLEAMGYIIKDVGKYEYFISPGVLLPPNKFLPPAKPGIAEVDLLLLVLSGERRPKRVFSLLWGDESDKKSYYSVARRLVQFGYLERDRGWRYHPGKRTMVLKHNLELIY